MTDRFEAILDESISALQAGVPIDEILAEVPEYATELRPLLYAATLLADPNPKLVPSEKKATLRQEYMQQVAELPTISAAPFSKKAHAIFKIVKRRSTRKAILSDLLTLTITILLTLIVGAFTLNYLALDTIPGDLLYGPKRISERVQLTMTSDPNRHAALENRFNQRRLVELEASLQQNRSGPFEFRGMVETIGENLWIVEGYTLLLSEETAISGKIQEGDTVKVFGQIQSNQVLVADRILLERN
jgi:hypothetical protein